MCGAMLRCCNKAVGGACARTCGEGADGPSTNDMEPSPKHSGPPNVETVSPQGPPIAGEEGATTLRERARTSWSALAYVTPYVDGSCSEGASKQNRCRRVLKHAPNQSPHPERQPLSFHRHRQPLPLERWERRNRSYVEQNTVPGRCAPTMTADSMTNSTSMMYSMSLRCLTNPLCTCDTRIEAASSKV